MLEDMLLFEPNFGNKRKSPRRKGPYIKSVNNWEEWEEIFRA